MNWSQITKELLATHEAFRRLKFPSASLFVLLNGPQVLFQAKYRENTFSVNIGMTDDAEELSREWLKAVEWWNVGASDSERADIYKDSHIRTRGSDLVAALMQKGMFPVIQNH